MDKINQELLEQLRNRKVMIEFNQSQCTENLKKLRTILSRAFPGDSSMPKGGANYYKASLSGKAWLAADFKEDMSIVALDDFFTLCEVNLNYDIF